MAHPPLQPMIADFSHVEPEVCPCGQSRRLLGDYDQVPYSVHQVEIAIDAQLHYHKRLTETYYFLECGPDAQMQLDERRIPVRAGMCIVIPPGVRHRALGKMTVLNIVHPKFDPADEWFD